MCLPIYSETNCIAFLSSFFLIFLFHNLYVQSNLSFLSIYHSLFQENVLHADENISQTVDVDAEDVSIDANIAIDNNTSNESFPLPEPNSGVDVDDANFNFSRSSTNFTGLKRFCDTRWSCLFDLIDCHIKNFGN